MKKLIDTGKTRVVKIMKSEYYCDICGKKLDKDNPKKEWFSCGEGKKYGCKNNPKCNPFHKDRERN